MPETAAIVLGGRRYEIERNWGGMPAEVAPGRVSQIAVDKAGRVHALRRAASLVAVTSPGGRYLFQYGADKIMDGHGISIDSLDRVWVTDRDAHQVLCFSAAGDLLFALGERHSPRWRLPFNHPTKVAVALDGEIYVADGYGNAQIHRFSAGAIHLESFGSIGRGPEDLMTPHSLIVDRRDRVLVCDRENDCVQVFDRHGRWLARWTTVHGPMDILEQEDGTFLVSDRVPALVSFSADGECLGRSRPSRDGAHGIAADSAGNVYLAEGDPGAITRLCKCP
jgi:peptidylglycine monooxygenase